MITKLLILILIMISFSSFFISRAQQQYSGNSIMACNSSDESGPSPSFLYTCYRENPSCEAHVMFRTKPPYISVSSISNLTSSDPSRLAQINNISSSSILLPEAEVIVPVACSCSGQYYQSNTSYTYNDQNESYFTIANTTFDGLTTCDALKRENPYGVTELLPGDELRVPLRCACPTRDQIETGTKYMFTYLIKWNDTIPLIGKKFNVSSRSIALANGFSDEDPDIFPFTTILIPLAREPLSSEMQSYYRPTSDSSAVINPPQRKKNSISLKGIYVGVLIGSALAVIGFMVIYRLFQKKTQESSSKNQTSLPQNFVSIVVSTSETIKLYKYQEIEAATENFSSHKKLSDSVYRGVLRGKPSVMKKTNTDASNEVKILGNISHLNLIGLYGVCEHGKDLYLVYEYLENGSLRKWLRDENSPSARSWNTRILIALDVAKGLEYLHNFTDPAYVHKNISTRSIFLTSELRGKIGNFRLARENKGSQRSVSVRGEKGYMAPEYLESGEVTPKIDVYALGVVMLELITGRDAVFLHEGEEVLLSDAAMSATMDEIELQLIDPRLRVKNSRGYVIDCSELSSRLLRLSFACLEREPGKRLSAVELVNNLMKIQVDVYNSQSFSIQ